MERAIRNQGALDTPFPIVVEQPVMWGDHPKPKVAEQYKALVDIRTGNVFSIVTHAYQLITHEEAIQKVEDILAGNQTLRNYRIDTEFFKEGARMRRTYTFPEVCSDIQEGDVVNLRLHLYNSYDRKWPFSVYLGGYRVVCKNGLVVGTKFLHVSKRHIFQSREVDLEKNINTAIGRFEQQTDQWRRMTRISLSDKAYRTLMETMSFGKEASGIIEEEFRKQAEEITPSGYPIMTLWAFYNVLTAYITLYAVSLNHRVQMENRLRVAMQRVRIPRPR